MLGAQGCLAGSLTHTLAGWPFSPQKRNWIQSNETQHWDAGQSILSAIPDLFPTSRCFFLSFLSPSLPRALKLPRASPCCVIGPRRFTTSDLHQLFVTRSPTSHLSFFLVAAVCALAAGLDSHLPARRCSALSFLESIDWRSTARTLPKTTAPGIATPSYTIFRLPFLDARLPIPYRYQVIVVPPRPIDYWPYNRRIPRLEELAGPDFPPTLQSALSLASARISLGPRQSCLVLELGV